ncbi:MAG: PVC-type heme-binding CxxCH protein, partial [Ginsengibacter sp.]
MYKQLLVAAFIVVGIGISSCGNKKYPGPLTPENALKSFQLDSNFEIQLFATEPYVKDPVSLAFDDDGNAFVAEMPDYPFPLVEGKLSGKIIALRDTSGDGKIDCAVVFADGLANPTSILPWKGGLIVTAAPNILYLKDTTGDFKADIKEVLFSGFFKDNPEAQITALCYGVDNWIYAANYGEESKVKLKGGPDSSGLSIAGADFRFRLDKMEFEPVAGTAQFGQSLDDWGHRFLTSNSKHIKQSVLPWQYSHRNPFMRDNDGATDISNHGQNMYQLTAAPYWRIERTKRRNAKYKEAHLDRIEYADNHFSGASGGLYYNGDAFPQQYYGNYFTTDVSGNLVHRDILVPSDSSPVYIAKLPHDADKKEFLASTDMWFRPTNLTVGPDGCLYVVDMYRQHIETPFSIDEDLKKDMNFKNGTENGRIYRIVPKNRKSVNNVLPVTKNMKPDDWVK